MVLNKKDRDLWLCGVALLIFVVSVGLLIYRFHYKKQNNIEGFTSNDIITHNSGIYDKFYSRIYDKIFTDIKKTSLELTNVMEHTIKRVEDPFPKEDIKFLDAGCGSGITSSIIGKLYPVTCLDKSNEMLEVAKTRQSAGMKLLQGDIKDRSLFQANSFSHIMCMYFTMYYFQNIDHIFENFSKWVKPNGFVIIHLVDKKAFDPIANPSSPFILTDPQSYVDKRKTDSIIVFNNFTYNSNFKLLSKDKATFNESFEYKDPKKNTRRQQHTFYMYDKAKYVTTAEKYGFVLEKIEPQTFSGYAHHYLFIFRKLKNERLVSSLKNIPATSTKGTRGSTGTRSVSSRSKSSTSSL
jgi:ubiquinone/menaquinone biosynthesis C-methylase UbiE